ncbi:immunoglobulin domain-containing protein [Verrucomicrobia bacterium]|nr:immunoglobulin domain-containing protein [Verrucomicrobiota bacterium]
MKTLFGYLWGCLLGITLFDALTQQANAAVIDLDAAPGLRPPENVSWARLYGRPDSKIVRIGPDDMIYVLGTTEKKSESYFRQLENKPELTIPDDEQDLFLAKYDRSGTCLWFKTFGVEGASDRYEEFVIDAHGNLLIRVALGSIRGSDFIVDGASIDSEISRFRGIWYGIVLFDLEGEFQESYSRETLSLILFGPKGERYTTRVHKPDGLNRVTDFSKLDEAGNAMWTRQFWDGRGLSSFYHSVQLGTDGKIYTAEGTTGFYIPLENDRMFVQGTGLLVARYSTEGWLEWYKIFDSEKPTGVTRLRLDSNNNITVAGEFWSDLDLAEGTVLELAPSVRSQGFLLRLDSEGEVQWGHKIKSSRFSSTTALSLDSNGGAYFMGIKHSPEESFALGFSPQGNLVFSANTGVNFHSSIAAFDPNEIYLSGALARPDRFPAGTAILPVVLGNWKVPSRIVGRDQSYVTRLGEMPLGIIGHPSDVELERDWSSATFRVVATGSDKIRYQWRKNGVPLIADQWHRGVDTSILIVSGRRQQDEGMYDVVLSTDRESLTSEAAELSFTNLPPFRW